MSIEDTYEAQTESLHNDYFETKSEMWTCPICEGEAKESSFTWIIPHDSSDKYVCGEECKQEWLELTFA